MYFLLNSIPYVKSCGHLCQILAFFMPAHQIWSCHMTQEANFKKVYVFLFLHLILRKVTKFLVGKPSTSKVISQKPHGGGGGGWKTPPKHFWAKQKRKQIFAAFTDFEKAFDTVWRCALLYKRLKAGIHSRMFNMIKSMYEETYCSVKCKDDLVKPF